MTEPRDRFLPPDLGLEPDDVVEQVEVVADEPATDEDPSGSAGEAGADASPLARSSGFDGIGTRREARERAVALLYEAEQKHLDPLDSLLDELPLPPEPFAAELVSGVSDHIVEIDARIRERSETWSLERMPAIDRAVLRLGVLELAYSDVPTGVCISEAVELAKRYSTDDSHRFVNGMLSRIADDVRPHA